MESFQARGFMYLRSLRLRAFRNYSALELAPGEGLNLFVGANALPQHRDLPDQPQVRLRLRLLQEDAGAAQPPVAGPARAAVSRQRPGCLERAARPLWRAPPGEAAFLPGPPVAAGGRGSSRA